MTTHLFKKTDAQRDAVSKIARSPARNVMLFGGARSGKTVLAIFALIVRAARCKSNHIIVRNTFNSVKNSIWMGTLPTVLRMAFPDLPVKWDRTNFRIILPNGSTIKCAGLDDGEKMERLLGLEFSTILAEECNQIPWIAIERLKTRLAEKNKLVKKTFYTQNPTTTTSAYYQAFEQGVDPVDGEAFDKARTDDFLSIRINPASNLHNLDPDFLKMLAKLPAKERLRFEKGEYDADNSGAAVYAFNKDEHVSEDARRLEGTDWIGSDFNIEHNSDVLSSQHANGLFIHDEIQLCGDTFKKADAIKAKGLRGASIVADSTGKNRSTKGKSDHIILKEVGFDVRYKTNPAVKDKIANLNRCFTLGLIKIHPRCKKLIRDLIQTVWLKDGELDQKSDPSLTHLVDALAYLCWYLYPLVSRSKSNKVQL